MDRRIYDNYVTQIAAQGSLTKAAAALGISQPALSSGLTALENELGFKIFIRKSVPITFTPEGEIYYDYLKRLQLLSDDLKRRIDHYHEELNGKVTIGGPVAYVESVVTDAVIRLRQENPNYNVFIKCSPLSELIEMAAKGDINCFISTSDDIPDNFEKQLIKQEKVYLCIPSSNPLNDKLTAYQAAPGESGEYFDYSLLDGEEFIFLEREQPMQIQTETFLKEYGITPRNKVIVNQVSTAVNMAIKGEGLCFASEAALAGNIDLSNVCVYALPNTISGRSIYIAYDKEVFMPTACKSLITHLINNK